MQARTEFLKTDDTIELMEFFMSSNDHDDAEGYDYPKYKVERLLELGAVRLLPNDRYAMTSFGYAMCELHMTGTFEVPMQTTSEVDEELKQARKLRDMAH